MPRLPDDQSFRRREAGRATPLPRPQSLGPVAAAASETGGGAIELARGLSAAGQNIEIAAQRIQNRQDAVELAQAVSAYNLEATESLRKLQTEGGLETVQGVQDYARARDDALQKTLDGFKGSPDGKARLAVRLQGVRTHHIDQASALGIRAQQLAVKRAFGEELNILADAAYQNPESLPQLFESLDGQIDDILPALNPEDDIVMATQAREIIGTRAVESLLDRGGWREAMELIDTTPGLLQVLSPSTQARLNQRITQFEQSEQQFARNFAQKRGVVANILGVRPDQVPQRLQLQIAGLPQGTQSLTPGQELAQLEGALEAAGLPPLTEQQQRKSLLGFAGVELGAEAGKLQSPQGKIVSDREYLRQTYGDDSEQLQAFNESVAQGDDAPSFSDRAGIRKEFVRASGEFITIRNSFDRISVSATDPSPAGDLSIIMNFAKMMDPGARVTERDFEAVAASGSFGNRVTAAAARFYSGERMTQEQRDDFVDRSEMLMQSGLRRQIELEGEMTRIAESQGVPPEQVIVDYIKDLRPGGEEVLRPVSQSTPQKKVIQYGLDGLPVNQ